MTGLMIYKAAEERAKKEFPNHSVQEVIKAISKVSDIKGLACSAIYISEPWKFRGSRKVTVDHSIGKQIGSINSAIKKTSIINAILHELHKIPQSYRLEIEDNLRTIDPRLKVM